MKRHLNCGSTVRINGKKVQRTRVRGNTNLCLTYDEIGFARPAPPPTSSCCPPRSCTRWARRRGSWRSAWTSAAWADVAGLLRAGKIRLANTLAPCSPCAR